MGFGKHVGRRDDCVIASLPTTSYDEDGKLVTTGSTTIEFWAEVSDMKSKLLEGGGKRRDARLIKLTADSRDVEDITLDHTITIQGSDDVFQVADFYQSQFRFTTELVCQYTK